MKKYIDFSPSFCNNGSFNNGRFNNNNNNGNFQSRSYLPYFSLFQPKRHDQFKKILHDIMHDFN